MPENLGLRRHILHCGDESANYDAIILLEDDIVVGPGFYRFARWAIVQYAAEGQVAGISLYAPAINEMAELPFAPVPSAYPAYALQSAQSWGQCWTRDMWAGFRGWYAAQTDALKNEADMPDRIYSWPESSWKKYAMKYLVRTGKTWVYPYVSHSTNCSDVGTHNRQKTALFQVPLAAEWTNPGDAPLNRLEHYDIYFEKENATLAELTGKLEQVPGGPLIFDLYGTRQQVTGPANILTVRRLPRDPMAEIGLSFRPHDINALMATPGTDAALYRIDEGETINLLNCNRQRTSRYHSNLDWRDSLLAGWQGLISAVRRRLP